MSDLKPKDRIMFPLDVQTEEEAVKFAEILKDSVGVFKIGLELFTACGPSVIDNVKKTAPDGKIFLDLKLHDIPATVAGAVKSASKLGVDFLTVHAMGGSEMLSAAASERGDINILGVTVLTSMSLNDIKEVGFSDEYNEPGDLVEDLADLVRASGCQGLVSSPLEVKALREALGQDMILVTPGIRPSDSDKGDQKRIATPESAIKDGSDYLVIGRPIRNAPDPRKAAEDIAEEIRKALN